MNNSCRNCKQTIFDLRIKTSFQDEEGFLVGYTEYVCTNCGKKMFKPWKSVTRLNKIIMSDQKKNKNVKFGANSILTYHE